MPFYSTNNRDSLVDVTEAILNAQPVDKGLYMPQSIKPLPASFWDQWQDWSLSEMAGEMLAHMLQDDVPADVVKKIAQESFNFPAPVVALDGSIGILELFHGPTLAFKDFGARFMARMMSYLTRDDNEPLTVLVATSGDTGGAVADAFFQVEGTEVIILYPQGKVSPLQEKQLTTLGSNIHAVEVKGTFDDCQALVKASFVDKELQAVYKLTSANSINIARLLPQMVYYFDAVREQLKAGKAEPVMIVPSGNFGNICAGLFAKKIGLPIVHFIAATNINKVVPDYLSTGAYHPVPSIATISNAMDVGAPSNFVRLQELYEHDLEAIRADISGYFCDDEQNYQGVREVKASYNYTIDPHTAIGYLAAKEYLSEHPEANTIVLGTAHPAKFLEIMQKALPEHSIEIPQALLNLQNKEKTALLLSKDFNTFKEFLLNRK